MLGSPYFVRCWYGCVSRYRSLGFVAVQVNVGPWVIDGWVCVLNQDSQGSISLFLGIKVCMYARIITLMEPWNLYLNSVYQLSKAYSSHLSGLQWINASMFFCFFLFWIYIVALDADDSQCSTHDRVLCVIFFHLVMVLIFSRYFLQSAGVFVVDDRPILNVMIVLSCERSFRSFQCITEYGVL